MKNININSEVWVKLTEEGKKIILTKETNSFGKPMSIKRKTKNGYTKFQLWEVMHLFGEKLYCGSQKPPIETNIKIAEEDLKDRAPYERKIK